MVFVFARADFAEADTLMAGIGGMGLEKVKHWIGEGLTMVGTLFLMAGIGVMGLGVAITVLVAAWYILIFLIALIVGLFKLLFL